MKNIGKVIIMGAITSFLAHSLAAESLKKAKPLQPSNRIVIDKIAARVNGVNILQSDLLMPRLDRDGNTLSLYDAVFEELLVQRAREKHMIPSPADVERQIVALKMANNISHLNDEEFGKQLKEELDISLDQYKGQLSRILAIENIKQAEASEKTFVTSQEIEAYFEQHPEYTTEQYHLKITHFNQEEVKAYKKLILEKKVTWKDLGWVNKEDIDQQFKGVLKMQPKQVAKPIKSGDKYLVLQLQEKQERRKKTLAERYGDIEKTLQKEKLKKIVEKLEHDLTQQSFIIFL